jgi:hypothetical protein
LASVPDPTFREGNGNVGIIRSPLRAFALPDHHKKYALAAKFFEYVFEPVIAEKNWIFYNLGFHRFISNLLYVWALAQNRTADQLMADFASAMRSLDPKDLPVFSAGHSLVIGGDDPLAHIGTFWLIHQKKIAEELVDLRDADDAPWMLDLTTTSLFSVLGYWGDRFDQLAVYCDDSKPLERTPIFKHFVNRQDKSYQSFFGYKRLLIPNLAHPVNLVRSFDYPGVQIADVFASTCRSALHHRTEPDGRR